MQDRHLVSVVIPTWRKNPWISRCLDALSRQTFPDFNVIVIWNEGNSAEQFAVHTELDICVQVNLTNVGFAGAANQGIRSTYGAYIALLNDDAFPEPNWLESLVIVMQRNPDVGACASLIVFDCCPHIVQSAGIAIDRAAIAWDRWRGKFAADALQGSEVFCASAGAALYRRKMFVKVVVFDERVFAYLEDVDLAWRAQGAGWRCFYVPSAKVRHLTSATLGEGSPQKKVLLGRNKVWMVVKNAMAADLPLILFYDFLSVMYALIFRRDPYPLRGRIEGWRRIRSFLAHRCPSRLRLADPLVPPWEVPQRFAIHRCKENV